ncbi:MAG TPA: MATE family efflux transporter [Burkholderiaceae bacterium]|nr:MATE family efflux transporter [Burkholderiaceae bacterium]
MMPDNTHHNHNTLNHRTILAIALPIMLSNVSTPLLGMVDTAVVGRIPDPAYIGAVAVGSLIFTFLFWAFGFLRMGTTGLTAQALGAGDNEELVASLGRSLLIAGSAGCLMLLLQWPIRETAFALLHASDNVEQLGRGYFDIRIWAAPATLANYALLGWFIGLGRTDIALVLQLVLNLTNIVLDLWFVLGLGWDVRGVAAGTVLAEIIAAATGLVLAARHVRASGGAWSLARLLIPQQLRRTLVVNSDIMVRSLALIFVMVWFTAQGAAQGDVRLAANAVLLQFISVSAYFLDGLAFAAEALVGRAVGAMRRNALAAAAAMTSIWAGAIAALMALVLWLFGPALIDLLSVDLAVREAARLYLPWAVGAPLLGVWAFQLDGIFIGATRTADMRNAMLLSTSIFLMAWWLLQPWENHGLWAALYVNYIARTLTLLRYYPALLRSVPQ